MRAPPAPIPVARPLLPPARAIQPYLRRIDANRWYSNHGPLSRLFQARLATLWGLATDQVALLSNATSALVLALQATGAPPGSRCLLPSWTFAASAGAVRAAGLVPCFVDVSPDTWMPDPDRVASIAARQPVGAILVVAPFGAPLPAAAWERVRARTGVPVVVDAAAAFDTLRADGPMRPGGLPTVVSLHATKVFGVGEGGALLCTDPLVLDRVRRLAQFGFLGTREAVVPGVNAKMSEYTAAVGLAALDEWPDTRARWMAALSLYMRRLHGVRNCHVPPGLDGSWVASTFNLLCDGDAGPHAAALAAAGVGTLRWWGAGCHAQPAFRDCPGEALPVTEDLGRRTIGLPFFQGLTAAQVRTACAAPGLARSEGVVPATEAAWQAA